MARIYRLIIMLLCLVCAAVSNSAVPTVKEYRDLNDRIPWKKSPMQACEALAIVLQAQYGGAYTYTVQQATEDNCVFKYVGAGGSTGTEIQGLKNRGGVCPDFSTPNSAGTCDCVEDAVEQGGQCVPDEPPTADEACAMHSWVWNAWTTVEDRTGIVESSNPNIPLDKPFTVCMPMKPGEFGPNTPPGCKHEFAPTMRYRLGDGEAWRYEGDSWALGPHDVGPAGGLACVPGLDDAPGDPPIPKREDPDPDCKRGIPGQVNGVSVCLDPASAHTEGVDWTQVTDGQGNTKEVKTEVKCEREKCTVTTTTKTPGGTDETTTTTTTTRGAYCAKNPESAVCRGENDNSGSTRNQNGRAGPGDPAGGGGGGNGKDGKGFCEENPNSPQCKEGSFGGSCASDFTCDGDAIQCAMAREQHVRACKLFDDQSSESRLYDEHKGKTGNQTTDLEGNETLNISSLLDTSDSLGGGSCVADQSITVWGQSITLPFSAICADLAMLGNLLVAVSMLLAMRIITRG